MLLDMMDSPDELHRLLAFMRDGVIKAQQEAEDAGDWGLCDWSTQVMPYTKELADPRPNVSAKRGEIWGYFAAQEFAGVSPALHEEFLLRYQMPIMEKFGIVAYGCCEDLTLKIDMLRKVPNLRRIAITPFANVKRCAEQIGPDYICSYRPNPAMLAVEFDEAWIGKVLRDDFAWFRAHGCYVDLCLKDVSTVGGDASRLVRFTELAKRIAEE